MKSETSCVAVAGAANTVCPAHVVPNFTRPISLVMAVDSACSNRLPSLKFVGDTLSVSPLIGLVILTFDLLTLNLVRIIAREVDNLLNNFYVFGIGDFSFSTYGTSQQLSDGPLDLATLTCLIGRHDTLLSQQSAW